MTTPITLTLKIILCLRRSPRQAKAVKKSRAFCHKILVGTRFGYSVVRSNLGAWFDDQLTMAVHITKICSAAFYHLHNIRRIRKHLSTDSAATLIHSFISSRIDYCNSLLYGVPKCHIDKLQRVQNAAARLVVMQGKFCHITPVLHQLHWLPVLFRINFKVLLLTFKAIRKSAPSYINDLVKIKPLNSRYGLRSNDGILLSHPNFTVFPVKP